jgi:hypothetical protein
MMTKKVVELRMSRLSLFKILHNPRISNV